MFPPPASVLTINDKENMLLFTYCNYLELWNTGTQGIAPGILVGFFHLSITLINNIIRSFMCRKPEGDM